MRIPKIPTLASSRADQNRWREQRALLLHWMQNSLLGTIIIMLLMLSLGETDSWRYCYVRIIRDLKFLRSSAAAFNFGRCCG